MALLAVLVAAMPSAPSASAAGRAQLGIRPVDNSGRYFDLALAAGASQELTVELGNFGTVDAVAMTYPADVFTLVNGGMGVRLSSDPTTGATNWVTYQPETLYLPAGSGVLRTFTVAVPPDTAPGEYITSVVIEDAMPGDGAGSGVGVVTTRVNRQAIAVMVTVPGVVSPALELGSARHQVAAGASVIAVEVRNSGNVSLRPAGEFVLAGTDGRELVRFPVAMGPVFAGTSTEVEMPFTFALAAGEYRIALTLTDVVQGVSASVNDLALSVAGERRPEPVASTNAPRVIEFNQPEVVDPAPAPWRAALGTLGALGMLAVAAGAIVSLVRVRRTQRVPAAVAHASPAMTFTRPTVVRQLRVPSRPSPQPQPKSQPPAQPEPQRPSAPGRVVVRQLGMAGQARSGTEASAPSVSGELI